MNREQLLQEQLNALLELLEKDGKLSSQNRKAIEQISEIGHGKELAENIKNNRGPPEWVDNRSDETGPPQE